jgi:hypothetical protein
MRQIGCAQPKASDFVHQTLMGMQKNMTEEIVIEIAFAIRKLGGEPGALNLTDAWAVNHLLEFLGADIYLMTTVGSWRDTLSDDEVLADLRRWNRDESLGPEISFVR